MVLIHNINQVVPELLLDMKQCFLQLLLLSECVAFHCSLL